MSRSFFVILISFLFISAFIGAGCANIIPPSGGPRDSLPPVLVSADPPDSTVNFRSTNIQLHFNEFVDLQDVAQNFLFTPTFESVPVVSVRLRTINIRIKDSLLPNTTYTFNFGNAIKDINEGNVLRNFVYTFSTGPVLDSLTLSGNVLMAETGKVDSTLIVVLHRNLADSAVAKDRPIYITRLDGSGHFSFRNLPHGTFAVYALGDVGGTRRYLSNTQNFAFLDAPVTLTDSTKPLLLLAYQEKKTTQAAPTGPAPRPNAADRRLRFTPSATTQQNLLDSFALAFEQPLRNFDSTKIRVSRDSAFTPVPPYTLLLDSTRKNLALKTTWLPGTRYNIILDKDFAEDTLGRKLLKTDTLFITTRKESDYGSLSLRIRNLDTAQHPVLQFLQNEIVIFSAPIPQGRFTQQRFLPGEYSLRILYDRNSNGVWDPGQFYGTKKQPEIVKPIERRINVKAGSDNSFEITAPASGG